MKFVVVFAAVLVVSSAQFSSLPAPRYKPARFPVVPSPTPLPTPLPFNYPQPSPLPINYPQPSPLPFVPAPLPPRPTVLPVVNRVVGNEQAARIVRYENDIRPDGSFAYVYDTENGISAEAQGTPRDFGGNPPVVPVVIQGRYSYTAPDGQVISIVYSADENGFQAQGDAIPTPPPIPEAILRSLDYLARNPSAPQKN